VAPVPDQRERADAGETVKRREPRKMGSRRSGAELSGSTLQHADRPILPGPLTED